MGGAAVRAIVHAEVVAYLHPLADFPAPPFEQVARLEQPLHAPVVTVYTKADLVPPASAGDRPLDAVAVSALTGAGLDSLLERLRIHLPDDLFHSHPDDTATQP